MTRRPLSTNALGILAMLGAILCFSTMDMLAKTIAARAGTPMALWARYAGQAVIVTLAILPRGVGVFRTAYPGLQAVRSVFLFGATALFFVSLPHLGLAEATAIIDVNPVLITLGAALILGERFGPRRAIGVAASLIGALIIIRPGSAVFTPWALLPLGAALCYSGYALTTRFVGRDESVWTSLFYTAGFGAVLLTLMLPRFWQTPDAPTLMLMAVIGEVGALGQLCMIRALQLAEASLIAPFGYAGLIFATIWGLVLFGEVPDAMTLLGMVVIALAGLYVWRREMQAGARTLPQMKASARGTPT